ncbi:HK97 gp10 family phage protein [Oscillospiraceae bacterium 50-16]
MSSTDYSFEGFDALERQLTQMIEQKFPEEFKQKVIDIAYELQGQAKQRTPHRTGILQEGWKVGKLEKRGDEYYIEVYNNVEYAEPVEYGHRTRGGKGFVKGKHMMAISLEEVSARLPAYLQEWLNDFISTHDL